jgi:hypothetical protein
VTITAIPSESPQEGLEGAPRVGPALSPYSAIGDALRASHSVGINLRPWQEYALDVMLSLKESGEWVYREVAVIAARQNGKTKILVPRIAMGLAEGERFIHTAQNRLLPRKVLLELAKVVPDITVFRQANGQEEIQTASGGAYMIVAPQRGARGESADCLIVDELREMEDFDFIAAAEPTLTESRNPQVIYLSNAGTDKSLVLNDLRTRGITESPGLAYMEWSADPHLAVDDEAGWLQANPSIGYGNNTIERMQALYDKYRQANELSVFETEHLCRWVVSMFPRLLQDADWQRSRRPTEQPQKPIMGINVDPSGTRVSVAYAWPQSDGSIGLAVRDFTGSPVDLTALAVDLQDVNRQLHVGTVGFDPWTDQHLARHFATAKAIKGSEFANASERFVRAVESGMLRWEQAEPVSNDLPYTARKPTTGTAFIAQRADEHRSISGVLAAIRAVWIASAPKGESVIY